MKKAIPIAEIAVVVGLFFTLRVLLKNSSLAHWQQVTFGAAPLSSSILFFGLPMLVLLALRRNPGAYGLTTRQPGYHLRVALPAIAVIAPVTILFPLLGLLDTNPKQWLGGSILAVGFALGGLVITRFVAGRATEAETPISFRGFLGYVALLIGGMVLIALLHPIAPLLARVILAFLFIAMLEELFFRGYIQSRLNDVFGRPFCFQGVNFGAGLLIAAALFGLMHPLTSSDPTTPWAWALWTTAGGLVFGFLREKTGAFLTPAIVHGAMIFPGVLFGAI